MLFNSITFLIFLPTVFIIYWGFLKKSLAGQNILILIASYIFYGWWDYRFLGLIALSTLVDYLIGLLLDKYHKSITRKILLSISLSINLGLLGLFKYYNFFIDSWIEAWNYWGVQMDESSLNILLPVGISFYTFQTLSYTIDIYRKKIKATADLLKFAAFVAFFPQLVAGPIERASHLLPQFSNKRIFNEAWAKSGVHLIIWGFFKKMVIADSCAIYANAIFDNYDQLNSASLVLGAIYFAFQIYADFSGYSDIAIGTARLFGFDLMQNFNYPYFSRNIGEFWRRWHISLSTWFRDYLYIPVGGSRGSNWLTVRNIFIIFIVSGFWHGANWTFLAWGGVHALLYLPLVFKKKKKSISIQVAENSLLPNPKETIQMAFTFILTTMAWIFFRANNISEALSYLKRLIFNGQFSVQYLSIERYNAELLFLLVFFIIFEWFNRKKEHPFYGRLPNFRIALIILMILVLGVYSDYQEFIYFQF